MALGTQIYAIPHQNVLYSKGGYRICERRGLSTTERCRRQCIEVCSVDQFAQSAEKNFHPHFSVVRMGSHGTFVLCTDVRVATQILSVWFSLPSGG